MPATGSGNAIKDRPLVRQQDALVGELVKMNATTHARLCALEASLGRSTIPVSNTADSDIQENTVSDPPVKRRKASQVVHLRDVWFSWYPEKPRLWASNDSAVAKEEESTWIVAFMKLFLPDGFVLNAASTRYRDDAMEIGIEAEQRLLMFLSTRGISCRGSSAALKRVCVARKAGELDNSIQVYRALRAAEKIVDPASPVTHAMFS